MKKFEHLSAFIECATGVCPTVETVKNYIDLLSKMGYNRLYLGMADAYKIKEEPYFNYKRGGYTTEDFKEMDSYAIKRGITLIGQIHTLSHLHFMRKYSEYWDLFDTDNVLMVGDDRVYVVVEHMIKAISKGLSSRIIHLGMDEAFGIGTGNYLKKYGPADKKELILKHIKRVVEIIKKYGLTCEIWGDMLIETDNTKVTPEMVKQALPEDSFVFLWDYDVCDEDKLGGMIDNIKKHSDNVGYAGGIWKYLGFGPNNAYSISRIIPQMKVCAEKGIKHYMITLWFDQVSPCGVYATLPTLYTAAEYANGTFNGVSGLDKEKFYLITGVKFDDMYSLEYMSNPFRVNSKSRSSSSFWVFYTDILLGNYDTLIPEGTKEKYLQLAKDYKNLENGNFGHVFKMSASVMEVLAIKATLPKQIREAYLQGNKKELKKSIKEIKKLKKTILNFMDIFDDYYIHDNFSFGVEFHHPYNSGQVYRCDYAIKRIKDYIKTGRKIDELEGGILPVKGNPIPTIDSSVMVDYRNLISYVIQ